MKRLTALLLAAAMAASMAACGSTAPQPAPTEAPETAAPETAAPETEAPEAVVSETQAPEPEEAGDPEDFSDISFDDYTMVDISHMVQDDMPADPALQLPKLDFFSRIGEGDALYNLEVLSYCVHTGTHMDAPHHVLPELGTIESLDPEVLIGPACIIRLDVAGDYAITVDDIKKWEETHGEIQPGEAVLFDTNHDLIWDSDPQGYISAYPHLIEESAQYLADKKARLVGCEAISPDTSEPVCHKILLASGTEIVENLCNLHEIEADRCYLVGTFSAVQGSTGVWTRVLAYYKSGDGSPNA